MSQRPTKSELLLDSTKVSRLVSTEVKEKYENRSFFMLEYNVQFEVRTILSKLLRVSKFYYGRIETFILKVVILQRTEQKVGNLTSSGP